MIFGLKTKISTGTILPYVWLLFEAVKDLQRPTQNYPMGEIKNIDIIHLRNLEFCKNYLLTILYQWSNPLQDIPKGLARYDLFACFILFMYPLNTVFLLNCCKSLPHMVSLKIYKVFFNWTEQLPSEAVKDLQRPTQNDPTEET